MNNKTIIISLITIIFLVSLFLLLSFLPFSQIFGEVMYKTNQNFDNKILLTFDDGPSQYTEEILEILYKNNVTALFFLVGNQVKQYPNLTIKISENHLIGVHSMTHPYLIRNNKEEIINSKNLIEKTINKKVKYFRPPYGFRIPKTIRVAKEQNLTTLTWSNFPRDYNLREENDYKIIIKRVLKNINQQDIIVLHDLNNRETVKALDLLIKEIKEQGLELYYRE